ncbi:hypothetical protein C8R46DRAFT_1241748 [Mycena filopes]|nr:hypothetical protein C8R46DRAFT_1241748 [Mycena filopes]
MSSILRALPVLLLASHALAGPVSARSDNDNFLACMKKKTGLVLADMQQAQNIRDGITAPETCTQKEYNTMFDACCKSTGESHSGNMSPMRPPPAHDADDRHGTPPPDASSDIDPAASKAVAPPPTNDGSLSAADASKKLDPSVAPKVSQPPSTMHPDEKAPNVKDAKGSDPSLTAQPIPLPGDAEKAPTNDGLKALPDSSDSGKKVKPSAEGVPKKADGPNVLPDSSVPKKKVEVPTASSAENLPIVNGPEAGSNALPNSSDAEKEKKVEPIAAPKVKGSEAGSNALPNSSDAEKMVGPNAGKLEGSADATKATAHTEVSLGKDADDRKSSPAIKLDAPADAMSPAGGKDDERKKVVDLNSPATTKSAPNAESEPANKFDAGGKGIEGEPLKKMVDLSQSEPNAESKLTKEPDAGGKESKVKARNLSRPTMSSYPVPPPSYGSGSNSKPTRDEAQEPLLGSSSHHGGGIFDQPEAGDVPDDFKVGLPIESGAVGKEKNAYWLWIDFKFRRAK